MSESNASYIVSRDDEIDLFELLGVLKESWTIWVAATLVGGLVAFGIAQTLPPNYEASSLVRIGTAGPMGQVEPTPVAMERIKSRSFQAALCDLLACNKAERDSLAKRITITQPKGTDVLALTVKAGSSVRAGEINKAVVQLLRMAHAELAEPALQNIRKQLAADQKRLQELEAQRHGVFMQVSRAKGDAAAAVAVLHLAQMTVSAEQVALTQRVADLSAALSATKTRPTEQLQAMYMSDEPVSPKKLLITLAGIFMGGFVGVVAAFIRVAWRKRNSCSSFQ